MSSSSVSQHSNEIRLLIAMDAAVVAGNLQMEKLHQPRTIDTKSSAIDLVTDVDRACDVLIRQTLQQQCASHDLDPGLFLTEESFQESDGFDLSRTWIVDPLDGTTNYAHGFPHFSVSIAYLQDGISQVGVVYDPFKKEIFTALRGGGVTLNSQRIQVGTLVDLQHTLLATGFPYDRSSPNNINIRYFEAFIAASQGVRRAGSAALDLAYVACGRLDGFWELRLAPWDVAAGALLVTEAGGVVSDFSGDALMLGRSKVNILGAGSESLHTEMRQVCERV